MYSRPRDEISRQHGGQEHPTVGKWGDHIKGGKSIGNDGVYSQHGWSVSESGDFLINKDDKSIMIVVPDGYEINNVEYSDYKGYGIKEKK